MSNEIKTMHLFAGHGGGLLADLILGHTPVVAVEWDGYACQVLRERAADGWFPGLRVWEGDVRLFDPSEYAGEVDCIHAGFPCTDLSVAGKQAGLGEGTRSGLYREVLRIAGVVRPKQLFLENVSAILSNGLGTVLGDLAALGYDTRWLCIRASDVGANHQRDRWFLLANANNGRLQRRGAGADAGTDVSIGRGISTDGTPNFRDAKAEILADTGCARVHERRGLDESGEDVRLIRGNVWNGISGGSKKEGEILADTQSQRSNGGNDNPRVSMGQQEVPESGNSGWASNVADTQSQRQRNERTQRSEQEYTHTSGPGWWEAESLVGRVADGIPHRVHRLKGLGNAQVPLQAAAAYRLLGGL